MGLYNRLRLNIKHEHVSINAKQRQVESAENPGTGPRRAA
jgi:hypothetical protein